MLRTLVIVTAMFGYVLSYRSFYAFHLVAFFWLYMAALRLAFGERIIIQVPELLAPLALLSIYIVASGLWSVDMRVWARYTIYWFCGLTALVAVYQSATERFALWKTAQVIGTIWALNMGIGLMEVAGIFRLPMSPYSPYVGLFGYTGIDLSAFSEAGKQALERMPTGFNWNQNNFAFVLMLGLPFVILHHERKFATLGLFLGFFLLITIGSKGIFIALIFMLALTPAYLGYSGRRAILLMLFFLIISGSIVALLSLVQIEIYGIQRIVSIFDQLIKGISMMAWDPSFTKDSTGTRAHIYRFGLEQFLASPGWGLGLGGAESSLIHKGFAIQSFHFFFLQMLVDLGAVVFGLFITAYLWLIFKLRSVALKFRDQRTAYLARACSLALAVAIPASITPSGVHYELAYYMLVGLGLAILKVYLMEGTKI